MGLSVTITEGWYQCPVSTTYTVMSGLAPTSTSFFAASYKDVKAGPSPDKTG
jgi:hypothetical protein